MNIFDKPPVVLAYGGWISVFIESWLLVLRIIPNDVLSYLFFAFFFFIAIMATAVASNKK